MSLVIKVGDVLELKDFDTKETRFEKVTSILNPDSDDDCFQVRTINLNYDFTNFYEIVKVLKVSNIRNSLL